MCPPPAAKSSCFTHPPALHPELLPAQIHRVCSPLSCAHVTCQNLHRRLPPFAGLVRVLVSEGGRTLNLPQHASQHPPSGMSKTIGKRSEIFGNDRRRCVPDAFPQTCAVNVRNTLAKFVRNMIGDACDVGLIRECPGNIRARKLVERVALTPKSGKVRN